MSARRGAPTDLPAVARVFRIARSAPERGIVAAALPMPFVECLGDTMTVVRGALGLHPRIRLFVEEQGAMRAAALVYAARRPEWVVLFLAARTDPGGMDGAFRLLSGISANAAREGAHRLFASVPDFPAARETFFQAGFYSYSTQTWYVARRRVEAVVSTPRSVHPASSVDAHDLFLFYARTTPDAVRRAEELSVPDFDVDRGAGALAPPHLVEGNPAAMRRGPVLAARDGESVRGLFVGFHGAGAHPHVCKIRTCDGDVDLARDLLRIGASSLDDRHPVASPVRPYEEHVARALEAEGFRAMTPAMLFVKELAVRIEEPALAPAIVR